MTQEEKLKEAKRLYETANSDQKYILETLFPELKKSEDERIKKILIDYFKTYKKQEECGINTFFGIPTDNIIAWLENQGDLTIRFFTDEFEWALGRIITFWNQNHKDGKYDENELMYYIKVRETELVKLFTGNICKVSLSDCSEKYRKAYYDGYNKCNRDWLKIKDISVDEYNKNAEILLDGQGEQKSADKVEPKFHEGDWIVSDKNNVVRIKSIDSNYYVLENTMRFTIDYVDKCWHLWSLEDAKDGDVLVCNINKAEIGGDIEKLPNITQTICIYQNVVKDHDYIHSYCSLYDGSSLVLQNTMYYNTFVYNIHPATKEQRDLLFSKMKEERCEWDAEKKELRKIVVPIFNIGDTIAKKHNSDIHDFGSFVVTDITDGKYWYNDRTICDITEQDEWELYEPIRQNPAWSEEDEKRIANILSVLSVQVCLDGATGKKMNPYQKEIDWLKSLRQRIGG